MSETENEVNEGQLQEAREELTKATIDVLKKFMVVPPMQKTWDEIEKGIHDNKVLKEICNVSDEYMESEARLGIEMLDNKDYQTALEIFGSLCILDMTNGSYLHYLGKSFEGQNRFNEALQCYSLMMIATEGFEPLAYLDLGACYMFIGDYENAIEMFEAGKSVCLPDEQSDRELYDLMDELIGDCQQ